MNPGEGLIRRARRHRGVTAAELAAAAGVHPHTLLDAETKTWPTLRQIHRFAALLGYEVRIHLEDPKTGHRID